MLHIIYKTIHNCPNTYTPPSDTMMMQQLSVEQSTVSLSSLWTMAWWFGHNSSPESSPSALYASVMVERLNQRFFFFHPRRILWICAPNSHVRVWQLKLWFFGVMLAVYWMCEVITAPYKIKFTRLLVILHHLNRYDSPKILSFVWPSWMRVDQLGISQKNL